MEASFLAAPSGGVVLKSCRMVQTDRGVEPDRTNPHSRRADELREFGGRGNSHLCGEESSAGTKDVGPETCPRVSAMVTDGRQEGLLILLWGQPSLGDGYKPRTATLLILRL